MIPAPASFQVPPQETPQVRTSQVGPVTTHRQKLTGRRWEEKSKGISLGDMDKDTNKIQCFLKIVSTLMQTGGLTGIRDYGRP